MNEVNLGREYNKLALGDRGQALLVIGQTEPGFDLLEGLFGILIFEKE